MPTTHSNSGHEASASAAFGRPKSSLYFTLDVLTDGSEFTGHGTIFLSVWKRPKTHHQQKQQQCDGSWASSAILDIISTSTPLARYAISGLGDATARLCADQRLKLASTRAVFVPSCNHETEYPTDSVRSDGTCSDGYDCNSENDRRRLGSSSFCWDGLPALLLALHTAGAASLHIVTPTFQATSCPNDDTVKSDAAGLNGIKKGVTDEDPLEELATIILGRHKDLKICTCHVPTCDMQRNNVIESEPLTTTKHPKTNWWKVYDDEYLLVHATTITMTSTATNMSVRQVPTTVYLYSIPVGVSAPSAAQNSWYTFAVFPPLCYNIQELYSHLEDFPILADCKDGSSVPVAATIDCIVALNPFNPHSQATCFEPSNHRELPPILVTLPDLYNCSFGCNSAPNKCNVEPKVNSQEQNRQEQKPTLNPDPGILIRSQQVTKLFRHTMPWAFPFNAVRRGEHSGTEKTCGPSVPADESIHFAPFQSQSWLRLTSCTSVLLYDTESMKCRIQPQKCQKEKVQLLLVDRKAIIWERPKSHSWLNTKESLSRLVPRPFAVASSSAGTDDENEIDLDEEDEEEAEEGGKTGDAASNGKATTGIPKPCLVVLGTGCASPSAIRGASCHALIFPGINHAVKDHQQVLLLDCGEGATTMFSRHTGSVSQFTKMLASEIFGIWISHAHLDHYGGLPTLLRAIHQASWMTGQRQTSEQCHRHDSTASHPPPSKQARLDVTKSPPPVPWVMGPTKVLRFLDVMLHCKDGKRLETGQQWFVPMAHAAGARRRHQHESPTGSLTYGSTSSPATSIPWAPWIFFQNVPVNHSCGPSYGLLLAWNPPRPQSEAIPYQSVHQGQKTQWFCFSGDTRPCRTLVQACHEAICRVNSGAQYQSGAYQHPANTNHARSLESQRHELFLVHEATFQDDQQEQAVRKKHSTVSEALMVARDIATALSGAKGPSMPSKPPSPSIRVLLTHFSSRYYDLELPKVTAGEYNDACAPPPGIDNYHPGFVVGLAMDGLQIEL